MVLEPQLGASQFSGIPDSVRARQPDRTGEGVSQYYKAITLRSRRELEILGQPPAVREEEIKEEDLTSPKDQMQGERP